MSYEHTLIIPLSLDNIKAQLETYLRATKAIQDDQDIVEMKLLPIVNGEHWHKNEWEKTSVMPIEIKLKEEGVDIIIHK